jgi:hypothetical protein|tara:strand:- start:439 stop:666 length:228 start_codon:yes stop_codon:yes gene_type:complete
VVYVPVPTGHVNHHDAAAATAAAPPARRERRPIEIRDPKDVGEGKTQTRRANGGDEEGAKVRRYIAAREAAAPAS